MFHEPFLGHLPCSIDLFYFAAWLRDGGTRSCGGRQFQQEQPPTSNLREEKLLVQKAALDSKERLLIDSAAGDFRLL